MKFLFTPCYTALGLTLACTAHYSFADTKLEEMVVISSKIEMPLRQVGASVSVISHEQIALRGYQSVQELLRTQAGISATNAGGPGKASSLRIRGEEGYRTLVMIDGIETSDPSGTQVGPQIQHLSSAGDIERIEILRGPQGFVYGADAGGVVNIITKESREPFEAQINAEKGKYGSTALDGYVAGDVSEIVNYFFSANSQKTDGFNARSSDLSQDEDGYDNTTLHGKLGFSLGENISLKLVGRSVDAATEFDNCGYFDENFNYIFSNDCVGDFEQSIFKSTLAFDTDFTTQEFAYAETDIERENLASGNSSFAIKGKINKFEYLGSYQLGSMFKLVAGADAKEEIIENSSGEKERDQLGLFSELQSNVDNTLFFSIGARYDNNDDFGEHLSARITAAYLIDMGEGELKLRSSFGNGFRAPSLSEISYNQTSGFGVAAATTLAEEKSRGFDLGVEYYSSTGGSVTLGIFRQEIENEIYFDLVDFSGYLQDGAESESQGFELEVEQVVTDHFAIVTNLTYNDTKTSDENQRIRRPKWMANLGLESQWLENKLSLFANLRIAKDAENEVFGAGRVPLDDYEVLDASANYAFDDKLSLFVRVQNLLDEDYEEIGGFNTSERAGSAGVSFNF